MHIPSFPTYLSVYGPCIYIYILTKSDFIIKLLSASSRFEYCSNHSRNFFVNVFYKMAAGSHFGCPKITFGRILTISYHNFYFCEIFSQNGHWRQFWMSENHFRSHFWPFQIDTELFLCFEKLIKWPPAAILDGTTMSIIELVRDIWMSNVCVKFEERSLNSSKVSVLTTKL